jgi:hypothetical protein
MFLASPVAPAFATGIVGKFVAGFSNFCATGSSKDGHMIVGEPHVNWLGSEATRLVRSPVRSAAVGTVPPVKKKLLSLFSAGIVGQ